MRDNTSELKDLRWYGMAGASGRLDELAGDARRLGVQTSRWLIEHLLQAEHAQRAVALVRHHVKAARFSLHRDLAGFDFEASKVHQKLARQLSTLEFTETAQNVFAYRRAWHWQDASGDRHRGVENRGKRQKAKGKRQKAKGKRQKAKGKRQTGTSLFDGRFGQWLEKEIREGKPAALLWR